MSKEIILLNIYGADKPGITSTLTSILAQYNVNILDIGQAVIHENLDLGILFEVPKESGSSPVLKDMLFKAYELGIKVKFTPISEENYHHWVGQQGKGRYIVTLLGQKTYGVSDSSHYRYALSAKVEYRFYYTPFRTNSSRHSQR